jgi:hypothetical protein
LCVSICTFVLVKQVKRGARTTGTSPPLIVKATRYLYFCTSKASKARSTHHRNLAALNREGYAVSVLLY